MTRNEGINVKVDDVLFHTIFNKKIVVVKIITKDDIKDGWIGDFQYRFENETEACDTENWKYVNIL